MKPIGKVIAVYLGVSAGLLSIGLFHTIAAVHSGFKAAITLHEGVGPYSGKTGFGFLVAFLVWLAAYHYYKDTAEGDLYKWTKILLISLVIATLLTFTPITHFIQGFFH